MAWETGGIEPQVISDISLRIAEEYRQKYLQMRREVRRLNRDIQRLALVVRLQADSNARLMARINAESIS